MFTMLNYEITEGVEAYGELLYNRTRSGFQLAPLPFDANADDVIVSADNAYNPFGTSFGGVEGQFPAFAAEPPPVRVPTTSASRK